MPNISTTVHHYAPAAVGPMGGASMGSNFVGPNSCIGVGGGGGGSGPVPDFSANLPTLAVPEYKAPEIPKDLAANAMPVLPDLSKPPGVGIAKGTAKAAAKTVFKAKYPNAKIPKSAKAAGTAYSAYKTAEKLVDKIDEAMDNGESVAEATACQTAQVIVEEVVGGIFKGAVVGGIPAYMTAAVAEPIIAMTMPFVLPKIPDAYQAAQAGGSLAGNTAEWICHKGFEAAEKISKGEN